MGGGPPLRRGVGCVVTRLRLAHVDDPEHPVEPSFGPQLDQGRMWQRVDPEDFPFFHYGRGPASAWGQQIPVYAGILGLYVVLFLMAAYWALVRLEP